MSVVDTTASNTANNQVTLFEVGARDGLQNEKMMIPTADKVELINRLSQAGLRKIEATSFVSPKWVPQMADASEVMAGIERKPGVVYSALTPNLRGYERAQVAGVDEVAIFAAASETFSQKNINCSVAESVERFSAILVQAKRDNILVRGYISCVVDCPYEGKVAPAAVAAVAEQLMALGCYEVSLGDTIGSGTPEGVTAMLEAVLQVVDVEKLAGHYHDTNHQALANIEVSLAQGLRTFDSAVGGLGGCPYAPGAKGNVATEAVVTLLTRLGYETGVDAEKLAAAGQFIGALKARLAV